MVKKTKRQKLISSIVSSMSKTFGTGVSNVVFSKPPKDYIPSTNLAINVITSHGLGIPIGRMIEAWGESSSGKSLFLLDLFAQVQKKNGIGIYVDTEDSLDRLWAEKNGILINELLTIQVRTIEEFFLRVFGQGKKKGVVQKIRAKDSSSPILVGLDSIAAVSSAAELESEFGKQDFTKAKGLSSGLRRVILDCEKYGVALVLLNQLREIPMLRYGNPEIPPGGRAVRFFATATLKFKARKKLLLKIEGSKEERIIGIKSRVQVEKNRMTRPFGIANVNILFDQGMTKWSGLIEVLLKSGIIKRKKNSGTYHWDKYKFSKKNFRKFVTKHPEILRSIPEEILEGDERYEAIADEEE